MKKGHGKDNGQQQEELREPRGLRREIHDKRSATQDHPSLQSRINNAVAFADREAGIGGPEFGFPDKSSYCSSSLSPTIPVRRPDSIPESAMPSLATVGVPGTPIVGGFLLDMGEYNPELQGRAAISHYEKMRRGDAQVRATLAACKLPVQSAKWELVVEDVGAAPRGRPGQAPYRTVQGQAQGPAPTSSTGAGKNTKAKAQEIAEFVKDNLFGGLEYRTSTGALVTQSWNEVVRNALLMLDFGCAIHEDVWTVDGNYIRLRRLAERAPLTFYRWHVEPDGETLVAMEQYGYRGFQFLNVLLPAEKMCRFTYQQEAANFWGIALQRAMYPHWYVKSQLYRIDAIANERNALGIPVFKLAPGFSKEDKEAAYNFVTQLATHEATGLVEPPGDQYTGLRIVGYEGRLRDVMPSIQHHNTMISIAALAMFMQLGQEGRGGSRALGESHGSFFLLALQNLADQIAATITATSVRRLVAYNFGDGAPVPRLVAANVQSRDISELADVLTKFATAGLAISDEDLRSFIRQELALPAETKALAGAVAAPRGLTIADENDIKAGGEIQGKGAGQVEGETVAQGSPSNPAVRKADGKGQMSELFSRPRSLRDRERTVASPFWAADKGHDPDLRMVHPGETHIDFPAHQAALTRTETAVKQILRSPQNDIVRSVAKKMAAAIKAGEKPTSVSLDHDQRLQAEIAGELTRAYAAAGRHVRDEHERLRGPSPGPSGHPLPMGEGYESKLFSLSPGERVPEVRGRVRGQLVETAAAQRPNLIASIAVQDVMQDVLNAAAHAANDLARTGRVGAMSAGQIADWLFGAINDTAYVDDGIERAAGEAARDAWRSGRSDEFKALTEEMARQGLTLHTIRVSVLEKNTCDPCKNEDGEDWDPAKPLSDICDGGSLCQCELMESGEKE